MERFKRSLPVFVLLIIFSLGILFVQNTWASKTLAEQIADLKAEALVLQKQLLSMQNFSFSRDLKLGDKNEDVLHLQKFLNSDPETQVNSFGPGSLGQETNYFGQLTFLAVIKFQNKYATEVLHPEGVFSGSGYVGALTRKKINSLIKEEQETSSTETKNQVEQKQQSILDFGLGENLFSDSDEILLTFVSDYSGPSGSNLTLYGSGFEKEKNVIHFGDELEVSDVDSSGGFLKIDVPNIPSGRYDLFFSNSNGVSNKSFFIVTSKNSLPPEITSIEPAEIEYGDEVTIHGTNFTSSGNELRTSYGIISNLKSSDGKTLKLKVEPYPETPDLEKIYSRKLNVSWPIQVYVTNENGVDKKGGMFTLNL